MIDYLPNEVRSMPIKLMKAIPIIPVSINAIPRPLSAGGTLEYLIFSRIAAMATMAKNHPNPPPKPNERDWLKLYSLETMKSEPPRMAQFTVIKGRNIPRELYNDGEYFSTTISTNCTIAAMTEMKSMNLRKVRSVPKIPFSDNMM